MSQGLKQRIIKSGLWGMGASAGRMVLRFASNLILTRLLFPEAFGLMAIVQSIIVGMHLFSDVGTGIAIIQHKNGDDPKFLDTAWTIQIIRNTLLFFVACAAAPWAADFYKQPLLTQLLPAVALVTLVEGFRSTKVVVANRALNVKRSIIIEFVIYMLGLVLTIALAWYLRSVWALVWSGVLSSIAAVIASHRMLEGHNNRWAWNKEAFHAIFHYGKWSFLGSIMAFFSGEGNKLIIGKLLDVKLLAFYTISSTLAMMYWQVVVDFAGATLFPAYSEIVRNHPERMREALAKIRKYIVFPGFVFTVIMVLFAQELIDLMYDNRYAQAGPILSLLAMGMFPVVIRASYYSVLPAKGMLKVDTILVAITVALQVGLMYLGYYAIGSMGVVAAFAVTNWLLAIPYSIAYHKADCFHARMDIPLLLLALVFVLWRLHVMNFI